MFFSVASLVDCRRPAAERQQHRQYADIDADHPFAAFAVLVLGVIASASQTIATSPVG